MLMEVDEEGPRWWFSQLERWFEVFVLVEEMEDMLGLFWWC